MIPYELKLYNKRDFSHPLIPASREVQRFNLTAKAVGSSYNGSQDYIMDGTILESSHVEKDLDVMVSTDLKYSSQIDHVVLKTNRLLGMLYRSIQSKIKSVILPLYISLVRPHLEYCVQAWSPCYRKDIDKLEKVQKRTVRMMTDLQCTSYSEQLLEVGLFSLEKSALEPI